MCIFVFYAQKKHFSSLLIAVKDFTYIILLLRRILKKDEAMKFSSNRFLYFLFNNSFVSVRVKLIFLNHFSKAVIKSTLTHGDKANCVSIVSLFRDQSTKHISALFKLLIYTSPLHCSKRLLQVSGISNKNTCTANTCSTPGIRLSSEHQTIKPLSQSLL